MAEKDRDRVRCVDAADFHTATIITTATERERKGDDAAAAALATCRRVARFSGQGCDWWPDLRHLVANNNSNNNVTNESREFVFAMVGRLEEFAQRFDSNYHIAAALREQDGDCGDDARNNPPSAPPPRFEALLRYSAPLLCLTQLATYRLSLPTTPGTEGVVGDLLRQSISAVTGLSQGMVLSLIHI